MSRQSEIELIRKNNPLMRDLYEDINRKDIGNSKGYGEDGI
jgi:hypothetical protein